MSVGYRKQRLVSAFCSLYGTAFGANLGVVIAITIEGKGGVIPTAASLAIVFALAGIGGWLGFTLSRRRASSGESGPHPSA